MTKTGYLHKRNNKFGWNSAEQMSSDIFIDYSNFENDAFKENKSMVFFARQYPR